MRKQGGIQLQRTNGVATLLIVWERATDGRPLLRTSQIIVFMSRMNSKDECLRCIREQGQKRGQAPELRGMPNPRSGRSSHSVGGGQYEAGILDTNTRCEIEWKRCEYLNSIAFQLRWIR